MAWKKAHPSELFLGVAPSEEQIAGEVSNDTDNESTPRAADNERTPRANGGSSTLNPLAPCFQHVLIPPSPSETSDDTYYTARSDKSFDTALLMPTPHEDPSVHDTISVEEPGVHESTIRSPRLVVGDHRTYNRPQPLRNIGNLGGQSQPRNTTSTNRLAISKPSAWPTANANTQNPLPQPENYAQATGGRTASQLDLSASSFPTLGAGSLANPTQPSSTSSPWLSGPPPQEQPQRQQPISTARTQLPSRQNPNSARDSFFSSDSFSRNRVDDFSPAEQSSTRRSSVAPSDRFQHDIVTRNAPPGLSQRLPTQLQDSTSDDPSRVTSPSSNLPQGLLSTRSPISLGNNGTIGQERHNGDPLQGDQPPQRQRPGTLQTTSPPGLQSRLAGDDQVKDERISSVLDGMSEQDKWGMPGFLAMYEHENPVARNLIRGQDLSTLGLDMSSEAPLLDSYSGPWGGSASKSHVPLPSQFHTPECYIVNKVAPVETRIQGYTDETLMMIFYTEPRSMNQLTAAEELKNRKWLYHIKERMWFMKDESVPSQVIVPGKVENGSWIWWDYRNWRKMRRTYEMHWDHVELPEIAAPARAPMNGNGGMNGSRSGDPSFPLVQNLERMALQGNRF